MELKDFVKETLLQISEGVTEAQKGLGPGSTAIINPHNIAPAQNGDRYLSSSGYTIVQDIEMEVAITVSDKEGNEGGLKVAAGFISVGGGLKSETHNNTISTIKFTIPMTLPVGGHKKQQ